jgi:hypothetical protein
MTTKHTAGEWTDRGNSCVGTHRQLVASVYPMEDENPEENAANVRLIAAAPDLLEFAQLFIDRYGMYKNVDDSRSPSRNSQSHRRAAMTIFRDLFGRPAPVGVIKTLEVLDCSDIMELAGMYGEARERGDTELMSLINKRMGVVIREQDLASPEAKP